MFLIKAAAVPGGQPPPITVEERLAAFAYPPDLQVDRLPPDALPEIRLDPAIGLPGELNITAHFLDRNLGHADRIAYYSGDRSISYRQLHDWVGRFAGALHALGIAKGDRVVLRIPNCVEFVVCALALHRLGAVVVPSNVLLRERILTYIANTSEAKALIAHRDFLEDVQAGRARHETLRHYIAAGGDGSARPGFLSYEEMLSSTEKAPELKQRLADLATMFFTSGTTGWPKGCMHPVLTIAAGPHIAVHMFSRIGADDVISGTPPLAFTFGYGNLLLLPLLVGAPCVLIEGRPRPEAILSTIEKHRVTIFQSVPAAYNLLLGVPDVATRFNVSSLREALSGSAPLLASTFRQWEERFGIRMANGMASSELYISVFSRWSADPRPGSLGEPLPGWQIRVLDEDGNDCPRGKIGRMAVRGPAANLYWRNPEKQVEAVHEGWSLTGDLIYQDEDGCYWHVCRGDDVIKSRGYRISPGEIEDTLMEHPAVFEPAVIGAPDPVQGQRVKAFVALKPGFRASPELAEDMKQFLRSRLAGYQVPGEIEFIEALPKTETGKVRRRDLKDLEERRQAAGAAR